MYGSSASTARCKTSSHRRTRSHAVARLAHAALQQVAHANAMRSDFDTVEITVDIRAQCRVLEVPTLIGAFGNVFIIPDSNRPLAYWPRPGSCTQHSAQPCSNRAAAVRA